MKAPMQELIQSLKAEQMIASNEWQMGYQKALSNVIFEIESMLEKEKEQIGRAYQGGLLDGMTHSPRDYYNETFNTNERG